MFYNLQDNSIRVWLMDKQTTKVSCIASATRHTAPVGSVAISHMSTKFFASVGQDSCLKLWEISNNINSKGKQNAFLYHKLLFLSLSVILCVQ